MAQMHCPVIVDRDGQRVSLDKVLRAVAYDGGRMVALLVDLALTRSARRP